MIGGRCAFFDSSRFGLATRLSILKAAPPTIACSVGMQAAIVRVLQQSLH